MNPFSKSRTKKTEQAPTAKIPSRLPETNVSPKTA